MKRSFGMIAVAALLLPQNVRSQERPLTVDAKFSSGYYSTYTSGGSNQSINFVPLGASFDINGYYLTPNLVNFSVQPELNLGPQAGDVGFEGGNGVRLRVNFLRRRAFPVTVRYSNVQLEDVYYGSLSQVSAYTLKERNTELGLTWELRPPKLPVTTIDWGMGSVDSQSGLAGISDYFSHVNHINVDSRYQKHGWDLNAMAHRQQQTSDLFLPGNGDTTKSPLLQTVVRYQASAQRTFLKDSEFYIAGGAQNTDSLVLGLPLSLGTKDVIANLRMFQRRRWKATMRAGYTSNLASVLLNQMIGNLTAAPGTVAPDAGILAPIRSNMASLTMNASTTADLSHGFGMFASLDHGVVLDDTSQNGPAASYFTGGAGVTYTGKLRWGNISGQYGRDIGEGMVTGQSGTIEGQTYQLSVQRGSTDGLQLNGSIHGSHQSIRNDLPITEDSFSAEGGIARRIVSVWTLRMGGGWQDGTFASSTSGFRNSGITARLGIDHPRFQINGALNTNLGNAVPVFSQLADGITTAALLSVVGGPVASSFRAMTFTAHANPTRKLEVSAMWTRSVQRLAGVIANDFELLDVHLTWHYRKIQIEAGYLRSMQVYSSYLATYPETDRGRMYLRIVRPAHLL